MKTWTKDNRPVVWTVNQNNPNTYDLYVRGVCVGERMDFNTFWNLYNSDMVNSARSSKR